MSTKLVLVRHGQTDWNLEGRYQGRSEVPLNATGWEQAEQLAAELASRRIDAIYSSTLSRSLDTARAVARWHALEVRPNPGLNEINQGEWEGMLSTRIAEAYPELHRKWGEDPRSVSPPGGESIREVHDRVIAAVQGLLAEHAGGTICLVTHKTAIVVIRCHYRGLDLREEMGKMPGNANWEMLEIATEPLTHWSPGILCCSAVALAPPAPSRARPSAR